VLESVAGRAERRAGRIARRLGLGESVLERGQRFLRGHASTGGGGHERAELLDPCERVAREPTRVRVLALDAESVRGVGKTGEGVAAVELPGLELSEQLVDGASGCVDPPPRGARGEGARGEAEPRRRSGEGIADRGTDRHGPLAARRLRPLARPEREGESQERRGGGDESGAGELPRRTQADDPRGFDRLRRALRFLGDDRRERVSSLELEGGRERRPEFGSRFDERRHARARDRFQETAESSEREAECAGAHGEERGGEVSQVESGGEADDPWKETERGRDECRARADLDGASEPQAPPHSSELPVEDGRLE
jgi:hypothetical protein